MTPDFTQPMRMPNALPMLHGGLAMGYAVVTPPLEAENAALREQVTALRQQVAGLEQQLLRARSQASLSRTPTRRGERV